METAMIYDELFPEDEVIVTDAHKYLIKYYDEYDFIWSSPPCPTHSKLRRVNDDRVYPDMTLYEEIIFLDNWCDSKWIVENVVPYYTPLITPQKIGRHLFWGNFKIGNPGIGEIKGNPVKYWTYKDYEQEYDFDFSGSGIPRQRRRKMLRNCVNPEIGGYILERARDIIVKSDTEQTRLPI